MVRNMTAGSPVRHLLIFSIPLLIGNVFQQFYNFTDTAIVGKTIGGGALAAVGSTGAVIFLVFGFFFGLTNGLAVVTGQRFGANDPEGVRKSVAASSIICVAASALVTAVCVIFTPQILQLMNTPPEICDEARQYVTVMFLGLWTIVFYGLVSCILRALGDSITPLIFLIFSCLLNVGLDLLFILRFSWGVAGAAWATVISQAVSGLLCVAYIPGKFPILHLHWCNWHVSARFYREHLRVALPMAFQFAITAVGVAVLQAVLNDLGTGCITAATIAGKIDSIAVQPMFSFSIAAAAFTAQNFGARNLERIRSGCYRASFLSLGFAAFTGALILFFSRPLTELFMREADAAVIGMVWKYLCINVSCFGILTMLLIYRNVLQGCGCSFYPMMAGAAELVVRIAAALILVKHWGFTGVCFAHPLAWLGAVIILFADYLVEMHRFRKYGIPSKEQLVRRNEIETFRKTGE